jgi:2-phospho-L-lactate guanylyltransferase
MKNVWALVCVKSPAHAKSRLVRVLAPAERAALSRHMAADVIGAVRESGALAGIVILSGDALPDLPGLGCGGRLISDDPALDWCANLQRAATQLESAGAATLLVLPADLPTLRAADLRELLKAHRQGVTVCPAARDGGTNALVATPPGATEFLFGPDSARRHLESAARRGFAATRLDLPAFARDIDTADDLRWLCEQRVDCAARRYLDEINVPARLGAAASVAC